MLLLHLQHLFHPDARESWQWTWWWWPHSEKYSSATWLFSLRAGSLYKVLRVMSSFSEIPNSVYVFFNKFTCNCIFVFSRHLSCIHTTHYTHTTIYIHHTHILYTYIHTTYTPDICHIHHRHTHFTSKTQPWLQLRLVHVYKALWSEMETPPKWMKAKLLLTQFTSFQRYER